MTPDRARSLRRGLLGLLLVVTVAVLWGLRRPPAAVPALPPAGVQPSGASFGGLVYRSFQEGKESFVVRAQAMVGQEQEGMHLRGVEVSIPHQVDGKPAPSTVTSAECLYDPLHQKAFFHGAVRVVTAEGLELETESLSYRGDQGQAESTEAVRFKRNALSGSSTGIVYQAGPGIVDFPADVVMRIDNGDRPPTEIRSASAQGTNEHSSVRFEGEVQVTQGEDSLKADHLTLDLTADREAIDHALALDNVEARTGGASALPGLPSAAGHGPRILRCRRLAIWFGESHQLQEAVAVRNAELEALPGPGEAPERRRLEAHAITFRFDEQGRLTQLEAGGGETVVKAEPVPPAPGSPRSVHCDSFVAAIDPEEGVAKTVEFTGPVEFREGKRRANSKDAHYEEARGTLNLLGQPSVVDEEKGSDLRAKTIDLGTRNGDLAARDNVRHVFAGTQRPLRQGAAPREDPTVIIANKLDYEAASHTARYQGSVLLRSAQDEVRAPVMVMEEPEGGPRHLRARGGVVSIFHPQPSGREDKPPAPVEVRARDMVYEEAQQRIVYTGEVNIRQGDIRSQSPQATVNLTPDGSAVRTIVAGEPVQVDRGVRKGAGTRATYTPDTETVVLVGEKVTLTDPTQQVEGRSLTFHVAEDRILVDGREEARTESIFKRPPPKK